MVALFDWTESPEERSLLKSGYEGLNFSSNCDSKLDIGSSSVSFSITAEDNCTMLHYQNYVLSEFSTQDKLFSCPAGLPGDC